MSKKKIKKVTVKKRINAKEKKDIVNVGIAIPMPVETPKANDGGNEDKNMRDAQYRKGLSIAFFNATNAAVECVKHSGKVFASFDEYLGEVVKVRNFFIEEHKNYYAAVVAQVGSNYSVEESVKKLRAVKNEEQLHIVWFNFSEDERHDMEIVRVAQEMKKKYEKA